jgi:hypothetical protein
MLLYKLWNHPERIRKLNYFPQVLREFLKSLKKVTEAEMADVEID